MTGPGSVQDLEARSFRTLTEAEENVGGTLLEDAWRIITARVPDAEARRSDPAFSTLAVQIECAMVLRVLKNPDGKLTETIDDYTYRLDAAVSTGALYLADAEADLLDAGGDAAGMAFTIVPAGWPAPTADEWRGWRPMGGWSPLG